MAISENLRNAGATIDISILYLPLHMAFATNIKNFVQIYFGPGMAGTAGSLVNFPLVIPLHNRAQTLATPFGRS